MAEKNKQQEEKEFNKLNKEVKKWKEFKEEIKEKVNIVSPDNYDEDSIIFTILKLSKKKDKISFIKLLNGAEEGVFNSTFSVMNDYFKEKIKKEYIKIEEIPSLNNIFGIIKDRIKDNQEMIKYNKKEFVKHQKELQKEKQYDKIQDLNSKIFWDKNGIESHQQEIRKYEDLLNQLKYDIKREINKLKEKKE